MVASEITPKEDIDVCIAGCIKSVRAGGGSGDIFTNRDLFVMHCDNLRYIVLQICITPDPGECTLSLSNSKSSCWKKS